MVDFGRVITATIVPFDADGNVNYAVMEKLAVHLVDRGSDTLLVCGTTGESPTLTWEEEYELFRVVKNAVSGRAKVMAGTGSNSTREAIEATSKAAALGLDGSLQVVPYYNKPPQEGLYRHFRAIAEACPDFPLVLYNIPGRTGTNLTPETVARLARLSNIVAIKEASGSTEQAAQIRRLTPPEFAIYSGDDAMTLPLLSVGARGVVSVASHLVGDRLQEAIGAFEAGRHQEATQIHLELLPLFKALFLTTNPIPIKCALEHCGWNVGKPRLPLCEASEAVSQAIAEVLDRLGLRSQT
ncbi:4-hydroxy-tetrahydrodipicolinate synthase [Leptolyngbya valderiana BDU 20041]|uniref:4-hydroxy-tetrahydrodipicolinate synthase n=1 Tax=Baaleninema simplex TaxID=2862350 RepID=UPI0003490104|nr:4-hydroxy-tetrahydrodipicolinate synthase [Baaleninema simplex]MDC0831724.1 4-hydroxy-tetrahydrodipicolinate synthase [Geitlerinema sp. CS-897]OAB61493.1 4-hydroxy-tetrahydrodipicolinate synthase [Leptolyngbya valderiana BDU 20041]PPT05443.1 4-hydroxy-tetrahydrodipicolinate synthase [Geitlerinema sp. FC II]